MGADGGSQVSPRSNVKHEKRRTEPNLHRDEPTQPGAMGRGIGRGLQGCRRWLAYDAGARWCRCRGARPLRVPGGWFRRRTPDVERLPWTRSVVPDPAPWLLSGRCGPRRRRTAIVAGPRFEGRRGRLEIRPGTVRDRPVRERQHRGHVGRCVRRCEGVHRRGLGICERLHSGVGPAPSRGLFEAKVRLCGTFRGPEDRKGVLGNDADLRPGMD